MFNINKNGLFNVAAEPCYKMGLFLLVLFGFGRAAGQVPVINYQTPKKYFVNTAIAPLQPNNTGGAVPANIYGTVSTVAGSGSFVYPYGIVADKNNNLYIADAARHIIQLVSPAGMTGTFAGLNNMPGNTNGKPASFFAPSGLAVDAAGNIYVADQGNYMVRQITPAGVTSTYAGSGIPGFSNGLGNNVKFSNVRGVAVDKAGNVYVTDSGNNLIREIATDGTVSTYAGTGGVGANNGAAATATFSLPFGITIDGAGSLFITDQANNLLRKISPAKMVSTIAGNGQNTASNGNGQATSASFNGISSVAVDNTGNIFVSDRYTVRKITPAGNISTLAGNLTSGGFVNGLGTGTRFDGIVCMAIGADGNLYVTDQANSAVRKIITTGYTIDKTLPPGLSFDPKTGIISGTPTEISPATDYTVTAYNAAGSSSTVVNIQVDDVPELAYPSPQVYVVNQSIGSLNHNPGLSGVIYSVSPSLPQGLTIDPVTGIISGTPTLVSPETDYTVSALEPYDEIFTAVINITVVPASTGTPLTMQPFPPKTQCDADFMAVFSGGTGRYDFTSTNPAVATINEYTGLIHILSAGSTTITVTDRENYFPLLFTVSPSITPSVTITPGFYAACDGMSLTYTAIPVNGGSNPSYQWYVNGMPSGTNSSQFSSTTFKTDDQITCTITNNTDNCVTSSTASSTPSSLRADPYTTPALSIVSSANGTVTAGTEITFTAEPTNGGTAPAYQWQVNGTNAGKNSITYSSNCLADGDIVTCIVNYQTGACVTSLSAASNPIIVNIANAASKPAVAITASLNNVFAGTLITFKADVINATATAYQWQVDGINTGLNSPYFSSNTLNNNDKVTCVVTTDDNCIAPVTSNEITIIILPPVAVVPPNTFTPNGDGHNDLWDIPNLSFYPACKVDVYNRYGSLLFESKGYGKSWDGTFNGNSVPPGTYYYVIQLNSRMPKLSGSVTVIR